MIHSQTAVWPSEGVETVDGMMGGLARDRGNDVAAAMAGVVMTVVPVPVVMMMLVVKLAVVAVAVLAVTVMETAVVGTSTRRMLRKRVS